MKKLIGGFSVLALAACASAPTQAPVAATPARPLVVVPTPNAGATAATAAPDASDPNAVQHADLVKRALKSGYQVAKQSDGSKRYCIEKTPLGTRFSQKVCYTPEQLVDVFARQDLQQDQMHQMGACGSAACGGSN